MRPPPFLVVVALLAPAAPAAAAGSPSATGGSAYGGSAAPLRVGSFAIAPESVGAGAAATVSFRVDGGAGARARMRVALVPAGACAPVATLQLGRRRLGVTVVRQWILPGTLDAGDYVARLHAVDRAGHTLKRTAAAPGKLSLSVTAPAIAPSFASAGTSGVFPVRGAYDLGGAGARFGAPRAGHTHQGQDITAAQGTPIATPVAGMVLRRAVQSSGAGHYLIVRELSGADHVFMHLAAGSERVSKGDTVIAGQVIAAVGATGDASGPHLHFELWPSGWYAPGSRPIDPLPQLQAWAAAGR